MPYISILKNKMQNRCKCVVIALNFIDLCACMKCEFMLKEAELYSDGH